MDFAKAEQKGRDTVLSGTRFFDLQQTLDNGQAFRWARVSGADENKTAAQKFSHFTGIAHGRRLELVFCKNALTIKNCSLEEFEAVWKKYFDFTRCYEEIHSRLSEFSQEKNARENEILRRAINFAPGLRLLRQDVWEVLISFILSQNSNIPRIKKMVESLCENFGEKSACGGFAFP
ncbi:MAG: hypothetical protein FWD19_02650, partial [Defluviitaleaceae bacterium]|nr:hypothetical protein [Defluviitaleaceae bacterium]